MNSRDRDVTPTSRMLIDREQWRHVTVPAYIRAAALPFAVSYHICRRRKCVIIHNISVNVYIVLYVLIISLNSVYGCCTHTI